MKVIRDIEQFPQLPHAVVTSGTFDGVHVGHQKIIERLIQRARQSQGQSVVVTYWPHPRLVVPGDHASLRLLSTIEERIEQLSRYPIDYLLIIPFTPAFASLDRADYVRRILVETLRTKVLIIGYDHRFGKGRAGSLAYLQQHTREFGFSVEEIPAQDIDQVAVSSTRIRKALEQGDITTATAYLGHPYALKGQVTHGKKLGRTIGFPTANLEVADAHKLIPAQGIYAVRVQVGDALYGGMLSIGTNPTVGGTGQTIEVHIFDFDRDIYGQVITLYFIDYIRPEEKFNGLEELTAKLREDQAVALAILSGK
jgi:riboflavin kinase / FMN adenylyltransferase